MSTYFVRFCQGSIPMYSLRSSRTFANPCLCRVEIKEIDETVRHLSPAEYLAQKMHDPSTDIIVDHQARTHHESRQRGNSVGVPKVQ